MICIAAALLTAGASAGCALIEAQCGVDRAHLLVDRLHFRAAAESAASTTTPAPSGIAGSGIAASVSTATSLAALRGITTAGRPISTAESAAISGRTQRHHLGAQIVQLLLLLRMSLEHVIDFLAVGVRDLRSTALETAATLRWLLLPLLRERNLAVGTATTSSSAAGRARSTARTTSTATATATAAASVPVEKP